MRITANQVTLGRLAFLPVPVLLMSSGMASPPGSARTSWLLASLGAYVLLGLTDLWDGVLARRHGVTPLGSLLDPLADKIFLVASYGLLAHFHVLPWMPVLLLFVRELGVTALRSAALEEGFVFRTSRAAKLKTVVQMAGGGYLLLLWMFPEGRIILPILATCALLALVPAARALLAGRVPGWNALWLGGMFSSAAVCRAILPAEVAIVAVTWVIVGFTWVSAAEYVLEMRAVLAGRFRRAPLEAGRLALLAGAVPSWALPFLARPGAPVHALLGLLAAELAVGGVDNSLVQAGLRRGRGPDLARGGLQLACGLVALVLGSAVPVAAALAATLLDLALRLAGGARLNAFALRPGPGTPSLPRT